MIKITDDFKVVHDLLERDEAIIFCKFLVAEKKRHIVDINNIDQTIDLLENKFKFSVDPLCQ